MSNSKKFNYISESVFINFEDHKLHLKRFYKNKDGIPCLLLHGSIENGKIFYSKSGKGLATFLADHGYDVFIADLRGRGQSTPKVDKGIKSDQHDAINDEIPAFIEKIREVTGQKDIHLLAHSWGGVLLLSYLARFKDKHVKSMVFFATKRRIDVFNFDRIWRIDILWDKIGGLLAHKYGYLPAKEYKFGSDNEPINFYRQVKDWAIGGEWIGHRDRFDFAKEVKETDLPPTLYLTGAKDTHMGHPKDVKRLMKETGDRESDEFILLSKENGFEEDYDHINILTHPKARTDHFPLVVKWLKGND